MNAIATTWDALAAFLNSLGTGQLALVIVAIVAAVFTIGRVLDLIGVLVRGHAPAEPDLDRDDLVEVIELGVEDGVAKLRDYAHDTFAVTESIDNALADDRNAADAHRERVEELLAQLLAATRTVTLAVTALDDDEEFDPGGELDQATAYAQLHAYTKVADIAQAWDAPLPDATDATDADDEPVTGEAVGTALHEYAEAFGDGRAPLWSAALGRRVRPDIVVVDDAGHCAPASAVGDFGCCAADADDAAADEAVDLTKRWDDR